MNKKVEQSQHNESHLESSRRAGGRNFAVHNKSDLLFCEREIRIESKKFEDTKRVTGVIDEAILLARGVLDGCAVDGMILISVNTDQGFVINIEWTGMPLIAEASFRRTEPPLVSAKFNRERCELRVADSRPELFP